GITKTRLQNFTLVAIDDHYVILQYQEKDLNNTSIYTVTEQISDSINEVNISVANKQDNFLTLCEVEIYG
ncbi:fucolectin-4, partial [Biomphalaria glabrata]